MYILSVWTQELSEQVLCPQSQCSVGTESSWMILQAGDLLVFDLDYESQMFLSFATPWPGGGQLRVLGWAAGLITRAAQSLCASPAAWDRDSWICTGIELQSNVEVLQWFIVLSLENQHWRDTKGAIFKGTEEDLVYYRICLLSLAELHAPRQSMCCSPLKYFYSICSALGISKFALQQYGFACCSAVSEDKISYLASWVHLIHGWLWYSL